MQKKYFDEIRLGGDLTKEAGEFVKNIPQNYGETMAKAIREAIAGNSKRLNILRALRMVKIKPLENVEHVNIKILLEDFQMDARLYIPKTERTKKYPLMLYLHGGGWTIGGIDSCADYCQQLAACAKCVVCAIDYRLSPEVKHPTAIGDCYGAYKWLSENAEKYNLDKDKMFVGGDSAGGHLSIALTDMLIKRGDFPPAGLVLFYPVTSMQDCSEDKSYKLYGKGYALDSVLMDTFNDAYIPEEKRAGASPVNFDTLDKFPPTLIFTSGCDILCDQGDAFARKLSNANGKTRHLRISGATHVYVTMQGMPDAFNFALKESAEFILR